VRRFAARLVSSLETLAAQHNAKAADVHATSSFLSTQYI
jgi:hypothetical protein